MTNYPRCYKLCGCLILVRYKAASSPRTFQFGIPILPTKRTCQPSIKMDKFYTFTKEECRDAKPEMLLGRMLSTKAYLPTSYRLESYDINQGQIGKGQCGTIFTLRDTEQVIKLPNTPAKLDELHRDICTHKRVRDAFLTLPSSLRRHVNIPKIGGWVSPSSTEVWQYARLFDADGLTVPNYGLVSERIYPLQAPLRDALLKTIYPRTTGKDRYTITNKAQNKDCLARIYLGRRNVDRKKTTEPKNISLRNFPLYVDDMERLGLDTSFFAAVLGGSLAVLHWWAGTDANDVEFVLGGSPQVSAEPAADEFKDMDALARAFRHDYTRRSVSIWLLDFNQCRGFGHDDAGLKMLVDGFWWNDPYYPRPNASNVKDRALWTVFAKEYLEVSARLTSSEMPRQFIEAVEKRGSKRSGTSLFG